MRSNIRTIQDYAQTTRTDIITAPGDNLISNAFARSAVRNLEQRNMRIPSTQDSEEHHWISLLNADPDTRDFRIGILANIAERRCDPGTYGFILRHMDEADINRLSRIMYNATSFEGYEPIISTILLGTGIDTEIGDAIQRLIREIRTVRNTPAMENFSLQISDIRNEMHESIQNNVERSHGEIEIIREVRNNERARIFSSFDWYTIGRRSLSIIGTSAGLYFGAPYLTPFMRIIGERALPALSTLSNTGFMSSLTNPTEWNQVHDSFVYSWSLFFRYWRR